LKIAVCVKQVPDTNDVKWSKENTLLREGLVNILNPYDEHAICAALNVKKINNNAQITLFTMGPACAKEILEYGLALGADNAVHLCDKRFSGSDTCATGKTLAAAIKSEEEHGNFDLIITGQFAIDGDTAQTGPTLAYHLGMPVLTYVRKILDVKEDKITALLEREDELVTVEIKPPAVLCALKCASELKTPKIGDYIEASKKEIKVKTLDDIKLDAENTGIKGSPTFVQRAFRPEVQRWCKRVKFGYVKEILSNIGEENGKKEETAN